MELVFAAVLIIGIPLALLALVVMTPVFLGAMAFDVSQDRKNRVVDPADMRTRVAVERGVARAFVVAGGIFWSIAAFTGLLAFRDTGMGAALLAAFYPLVAVLATLAIGWYFERATAALLWLASIGVVVWGVIYQFEIGVWMIMAFTLIGPMATAATLFWLARRDQEAYELAIARQPELAPIEVTNS
jgi:hypothetical protein